jgi:drug/metabolite transporter (DMT)-like permease
MHLYTGWTGTLLASLPLPYVWTEVPELGLWAGLGIMGLAATVGHFLLILAFYRAPAATITPYLYSQIAFAVLGGLLVFSHIPDHLSLAGMGMIAVCGAAGAWLTARERRAAT